jgi:hypothetical protein
MSPADLLLVALIGLAGGVFGGLLGIGGSIVMIPLLGLVLGPNQQLYQAACMIVNVVVAVGAARRHAIAGSVRGDCFRWMLPASTVAILIGVLVSNRVPSVVLQRCFGVFLLYVAGTEVWRVVRPGDRTEEPPDHVPASSGVAIGGATGLVAGLLGVGGGTIAVPLMRTLARLPLRQAIGTSSAVMTVASAIGAVAKNVALPSLHAPDGTPLTIVGSLAIAGALSVPALLGAGLGARLTYALPLSVVRLALVVLLVAAGVRMTGVLG